MNKPTIINQTLHGYSNGHHLLASSINLSDVSKRKMDILSDLSGPDMIKGYECYFSGYLLENEQLIVLAKTWYASEMIRPGCVWTHSLIININDIYALSNYYKELLLLFSRPTSMEQIAEYSKSLNFNPEMQSQNVFNEKKIKYLIWAMLGNSPPYIIISNDSQEYIHELLYIWLKCYNELLPNYSFSTGSFSIRIDDTESISLQFVPNELRNKIFHSDTEISIIKNINEIQKFPAWVTVVYELFLNDEWRNFSSFRNLFDNKYNCYKYLTSQIKLYATLSVNQSNLKIYEALELIDKIYTTEKSDFGNKFIKLYIEGAFRKWGAEVSYTDTLISILKYEWLSIDDNILNTLIDDGFLHDRLGAKKIVNYLIKIENNPLQEKYLFRYANILTMESLEDFSDMDFNICSVFITINPTLSKCAKIWQQSYGYQKEIFEILKTNKSNNLLNTDLIYIILDNSYYDFAYEIYDLWAELSINIFLEYLLQYRNLRHSDTKSMYELCKKHSVIASSLFEKQFDNLSEKQFIILINIINPYSDKITIKSLINIFNRLNVEYMNRQQQNDLSDFYLPIILISNYIFPQKILDFVVGNVHERLANLTYPTDKWNTLQHLLPELFWLNQWDKCKRLRKALKKKGYRIKKFDEYTDN